MHIRVSNKLNYYYFKCIFGALNNLFTYLLNLFFCFFCTLSVSVVVYYFCSFSIVSVSVSDTNFRLAELIFGNTWRHYRSLTGQNRLDRIVSSCSSRRSCFGLNIKTTTCSTLREIRFFFQHRRLCDCQTITSGFIKINRQPTKSAWWFSSGQSLTSSTSCERSATVTSPHSLVFSRWTRSESSILLFIPSLNLKAHWVQSQSRDAPSHFVLICSLSSQHAKRTRLQEACPLRRSTARVCRPIRFNFNAVSAVCYQKRQKRRLKPQKQEPSCSTWKRWLAVGERSFDAASQDFVRQ